MLRARNQAEAYAKALPVAEGWPPFLLVVDVGYSIEVFADFSLTGKAYVPFPDAKTHRIFLRDLEHVLFKERLAKLWTDPLSLDPTLISARVTRQVAGRLAELAKDLEKQFEAKRVAGFLMRCIFTSFAEDIQLLPKDSWTKLLGGLKGKTKKFVPMVESLWKAMDIGGFSTILEDRVLRFNGGLFENVEALPVNEWQLELLTQAAAAEWQDVEPAIFGTLLERALDPTERHRLGAHYTPRAYVERLVMPTVIEPLREDWRSVQTAAVALARAGKVEEAIQELDGFRKKLCSVRVLDPACGTGNFLYVTLEHLKRLEGEVIDVLESMGETQQKLAEMGMTVDPHQLLGMEVNPRAAAITDLVLWIGYLQWYFRTWGANTMPPEPVIVKFHNIESRDALLVWDEARVVGKQWDGKTKKQNPVTGEDVPDESAQRPVFEYVGVKKADWPEADFVVGNPPFIGNWRIRGELGDGYAEALRQVYAEVTDSADYVMYWWHRAAELARKGELRRFGFIATNSLRQTFNRRVLTQHLGASDPLSLVYAIPDHPWVDSFDGADVRISMTVGEAGNREGLLCRVSRESGGDENGAVVEFEERLGKLHADLTIGPDLVGVGALEANGGISSRGVVLHGPGFLVTKEQAVDLGLGRISGLEKHIRPYLNGRDLTGNTRGVMVLDLFGLKSDEVRVRFPEVYQWVFTHVKPERDHNNRESRRLNWWIFGEPISTFRPVLKGLRRYISTVETAKHRVFVFLGAEILPDNMLVNVASDDAWILGVLSSRIHVCWALAAGGRLGVGNDPRYNKTRCFEPFPFPEASETQKAVIRELGERLDAHRKRQQQLHPKLTLTNMYNVLEKLRSGVTLDAEDRLIHEEGLVSVLKEIHGEIDSAAADAYGWPADLATEEILFRLVALNGKRSAEEQWGLVNWLRPEYQSPNEGNLPGYVLPDDLDTPKRAAKVKLVWPGALPARVKAVRESLLKSRLPQSAEQLAKGFVKARGKDVQEILDTLVLLGQARDVRGKYVA